MPILQNQFEDIAFLVQELEEGDSFDINLRSFIKQANQLKKDLYYYYGDHEWIVDRLNRIPAWDFEPEKRGMLERIIPRAGREMVGRYRHKEKIMDQVRTMANTFAFIYNQLR